jgi:type I restriction enzyme S subunit
MIKAETYAGHKLCRPDDLVINTMWAWMGALGVARQTGIVSPSYGVYRPALHSALLPDFADLLLRTSPYIDEYICRSTGIHSSRLRLYPEDFLRIPLICPPQGEQRVLLLHVDRETAETNQTISMTRREIELIREYRTRLIADVVTGKVDVRGVELPDESYEEDIAGVEFEDSELDEMMDETSEEEGAVAD